MCACVYTWKCALVIMTNNAAAVTTAVTDVNAIVCRNKLKILKALLGHSREVFSSTTDSSSQNTIIMYRSLVKKGPVSNIRLPSIIASISCKGLKFTP